MNQDVELNDQKVKPPPPDLKGNLDFITSVKDRELGFFRKNYYSSVQINATAEDELVKKQFKEKHCELPGVPRSTFLMEFSPDGTKVASTHGNHQIYVTDVRSGKHIKTLIGHPRTPWCIAFHPTSNQIIASGCLGGQVRIWDLSGGSEVWTADTPSVIASIAFHPDDRLLVIATYNELFFWDWSKPEPFIHVSTASVKEKVRYVAFDKLGHKLITGITNSPQTRWERVRTVPVSVSVPVSAEIRPIGGSRARRRVIVPRINWPTQNSVPPTVSGVTTNQESLTNIPESERRITNCYRDLVHQYEVLVHRYLQIYRRPIMIDQGTDPMEVEPNGQPSTSSSQTTTTTRPSSPMPSTSGLQRQPRKSSNSHPPKNRNRRILYHSDSGGSSSSGSSSGGSKGKTSGEAQVVHDQGSSGSVPKQEEKLPSPPKFSGSSSSSDDNNDDDVSSAQDKSKIYPAMSGSGNSNYSNTATFTSSMPSNVRSVTPSQLSGLPTSANIDTPEDDDYNSLFKSFIVPSTEPTNASIPPAKTTTTVNTTSITSTTTAGQSTSSMTPKENINHLINNAKIMLAKYRETLQQRGMQVRGVDLPDIGSSSSLQQSGSSSKPSKGTNTNEIECPPKRKRRLLRPNLLGNILFTSSDDSSSDNEPQVKVPCSRNEQSDIPPVDTLADTSNVASNEHSYADVPIPSTSGTKTNAQKRKRRLVKAYDNEGTANEANINRVDSCSITVPNTSSEPPTTQSESLMDRQVQRLVVESLSVLDGPTTAESLPINTQRSNEHQDIRRLCGSCGGQIDNHNSDTPAQQEACARTATVCSRHHGLGIGTPSSGVPPTTPPLDRARRRFLSHRLSAFHPTRLLSRMLRDRAGTSTPRVNDSPIRATNFAQDEVINYAERDGEEASSSSRNYHPFDPPPEILSINPENIGIGSMYSNIVQELESSLNDVRNIRFRLGEMSDMLSNFSDRLENIMTQSNTILRNLSSSLDDLPGNEGDASNSQSQRPAQTSPDTASYSLEDIMPPSPSWIRTYRNPYATNNPVNSDHTYPINPEATQNTTLSPLHLSLQLTVTHIQRQARLLRQQVESIERIDRAMIEVAQLQMMRQMLDELHVHFGPNSSTDNRSGVSSVRQMMAGTRISDSSPYDSPSDEGTNNNSGNNNVEAQPSTSASENPTTNSESNSTTQNSQNTQANRTRSRKNYPRCLFLMHRQYRRTLNSTYRARRNAAKDRILLQRNIYRRFLSSRTSNRATVDFSSMSGRGYFNIFNPDTLPAMTRRLEYYLMEHCRYIGRSVIPPTIGSNTRSDVGEHVMMLRLNNCRMRMNRLMGNFQLESNNASVTVDGTSRFAARQALSYTLDTITRFVDINPATNISSTYRSQIWEVIELSLLLSELLLLQIVDSIPPPSGMNLDPERENLSMRIDRMCTRMIQSRLVGQSNQLTRSLRLMRLTVRHATQALGQTYTARRNAMLPTNNDNERGDSRQGLLDDIHNCLRNIRRYRELTNDRPDDNSNFGDWYRTINDLISRYTSTSNNDDAPGPSTSSQRLETVLNNETGEEIRPPTVTVEDANSSDDNSNNNDTTPPVRLTRRAQLHSSRSQDDDTEEERNWRSPNYLTVPIVQVNNLPIPDVSHVQQYPWRIRSHRQRLSERLDELRTGLFRPRYLHPLYSGVVNPFAFEDNLDEAHREPTYDSDVIPTVTPNHRIQVWEFSRGIIPNISNSQTNLVVNECKIHNDASVDYASDGSILVTLLPSGGYMNVTNRLGVYSLEWQTLGQCLYVTSFEQNAVSVSLSPTNRHLLVGLASRRVSILPTETWTMARIFLLDYRKTTHGNLASIRELEQNRDSNFMSLNCIRWLPTAGQGLIFGTNTGHLRLLT